MDDDYGYDDSDYYDDSSYYDDSDYGSGEDTLAAVDVGDYSGDLNGYDSIGIDTGGNSYDYGSAQDEATQLLDDWGYDYSPGVEDDYSSGGYNVADDGEGDNDVIFTDPAGNSFYADGTIEFPDGTIYNPDGSYELTDGSEIASNGDYTDVNGDTWENMGWAGSPNLYQDAAGNVWNSTTGDVTQVQTVISDRGPLSSNQSAPAASTPKSGGAAGGSPKSGGASPSSSSSSKPSSSSGSAPAKTIVADKRIGNDRFVVYSDGTSKTFPNYYAPATGAAPAKGTTVGGVLDNLFGAAGNILGAVNAPATVKGAPKLAPGTTSATPITGLVKPAGGANPTVPVNHPTSTGDNSSGLAFLALGAVALKLFILH